MIRTGGGLRPAVPAAAVAAAVAAVLLAGCTGSDPAPGPSSSPSAAQTVPTATPTPTPTPTPTAPALPAAATKPTGAGAEAFIAYFFELYTYAFRTGDPSRLQAVSEPECAFCDGVAKNAFALAAKGRRLRDGGVVVREALAAVGDPAEGLVVNALIDQVPGEVVDSQGAVVDQLTEKSGRRIDARVIWRGDAWHVVAGRVVEAGDL